MAEEAKKLTAMQQRFINFYIGASRFNATDAARRAGYKDPELEGWRLRQNEVIRARIDERLTAETLTADEILHELTATAIAPTTHFMQMVMPEQTDADGNVVAPMIVRQDYGAKLKALELLGKNKKMFTDNVNLSGSVTFGDLLTIANGAPDAGAGAGDPPASE